MRAVMIMRKTRNIWLGAFAVTLVTLLVLRVLSCTRSRAAEMAQVTAFISAVTNADVQRVQAFLDSGLNPNESDQLRTTPFVAALNQLYKPQKFCSPMASDYRPVTTEDAKRLQAEWEELRQRRHRIVELLIDHGGDLDAKCFNATSPLLLALDNCEPEIAELLLRKGADARSSAVGETGEQALAIATIYNYVDVAMLLIEKRAQVNQTNRFGYTPLMQAAKRGHVEILKALIDAGADVNARDEDGNTALMQTVECMGELYENKPELASEQAKVTNRILLDAWDGCPRVFALLIANGADIRAQNTRGETALTLAEAQPKLRRVLVKSIADHNQRIQRTESR